jgi:hypothetical protein
MHIQKRRGMTAMILCGAFFGLIGTAKSDECSRLKHDYFQDEDKFDRQIAGTQERLEQLEGKALDVLRCSYYQRKVIFYAGMLERKRLMDSACAGQNAKYVCDSECTEVRLGSYRADMTESCAKAKAADK